MPDAFFREWIRSHYSNSLLEAAEAVLGRSIPLSIRIHDEAEPPLGDVVEPAPAYPEPDSEPDRPGGVTIPLPGGPDAPSTFPVPRRHRNLQTHRANPRIHSLLHDACKRS